jgi:uncharacterized coiled-coil DUF342 family protein
MQRTLQDARLALDALPLTEQDRRALSAELDEATRRAVRDLAISLDHRAHALADELDEHRRTLYRVTKEARALALDVDGESVDVHTAGARFIDLSDARAQCLQRIAQIESRIDALQADEADPAATADRLFEQYPLTRPQFSW